MNESKTSDSVLYKKEDSFKTTNFSSKASFLNSSQGDFNELKIDRKKITRFNIKKSFENSSFIKSKTSLESISNTLKDIEDYKKRILLPSLCAFYDNKLGLVHES